MSLFIAAATANTSSITTDQDALLALKAHMSHDPTNFFAKNWNTSTPVCNWTGVACDIHSRRVTVLNISGLNLTGTIPSQLWNLSSLESLDLSFNRLPGSIPSAIFTTYTLKYVSFRGNQLSGAFPLSSSTSLLYNILILVPTHSMVKFLQIYAVIFLLLNSLLCPKTYFIEEYRPLYQIAHICES
ncbi:hypothetical protein KPL70_021278 [Citrus sinensis]|nr:hypothetical protein KPL70_021278 [Citrus sinensis]